MLRTDFARHGVPSGSRTERRRGALDAWLDRALRLAATFVRRSRSRRALAELSDHHLRDIGVSRADAAREMSKPFWR